MTNALLKLKKKVLQRCLFLCTLLFFSLLFSQISWAQEKLSGRVSTAKDNTPMAGVSIHIKGNSSATSTDKNGNFSLDASTESILEFKFIGYKILDVPVKGNKVFDIRLEEDNKILGEVVVTALGIKKEKKSLGYAIQEVKGSELTKARDVNAFSSLSGRVSGLVIANSPDILSAPTILLRGASPLIVVDGIPQLYDAFNISADDIETYSVLKGPTAAALYGSRGLNGAIQITTKRGTKDKRGFSVELNSSTEIQKGYNAVPKVQNQYGAGEYGQYSFVDGQGGGINDADFDIWGPKLDGRLIAQYDSPIDPATGKRIPTPWVPRGSNNLNEFFRTGLISTNNINIAGNNDKGDIRFSGTQTFQTGIVPNTHLGSTTFNLSGGLNVTPKLRIDGNLTYNRQYTDNTPTIDYGPNSPIYNLVIWNGADHDVNALKNYWQPGKVGVQQLNNEYFRYNNPFFVANEWKKGYYKDNVYGYADARYEFNSHFNAQLRTAANEYSLNQNQVFPQSAHTYNRALGDGGYVEGYNSFFETNTDLLLNFNHRIGADFNIKASLGANVREYNYHFLWAKTDYLSVPNFYNFNNSTTPQNATNYDEKKQVYSTYATADLAYRTYLYLGLTGRIDKSSTLPLANNTYFYPSVSLSYIVTEMFKLPEFISYLKLRASYARVGSDRIGDPSTMAPDATYTVNNNNSTLYQYSNGGTSIYQNNASYTSSPVLRNGSPALSYTTIAPNPNLKPAFSTSYEEGAELRLFSDRIGFDVTHFRTFIGPQLYQLPISQSTGFTAKNVNGITIRKSGWEVSMNLAPFRDPTGFNWDITVNWSEVRQYLASIIPGQNYLPSNEGAGGRINVGDRIDKYFINGIEKTADGRTIVGANGLPISDAYPKQVGYYSPSWSGGINNTFRYKSVSLSALFDGRFGGKQYDYIHAKLEQGGRSADALDPLRINDGLGIKSYVGNAVIVTGGTLSRDGIGNVTADTRTYAPNTTKAYYQDWTNSFAGSTEQNIISKTFVKLREVTLTYQIPQSIIRNSFINRASISFVARNLLYFAKNKDIDLDQFTDYGYSLQSPSLKTYGFNINLTF